MSGHDGRPTSTGAAGGLGHGRRDTADDVKLADEDVLSYRAVTADGGLRDPVLHKAGEQARAEQRERSLAERGASTSDITRRNRNQGACCDGWTQIGPAVAELGAAGHPPSGASVVGDALLLSGKLNLRGHFGAH